MKFALVFASFALVAGVAPAAVAAPHSAGTSAPTVAICPPPEPGYAQCLSRAAGPFSHTSGPKGLTPRKVKNAYDFPTSTRAGRGETIVIVTAFHAPNAERNLRVFSRKFDLPTCTVGNGCFRQVFARGTQPPHDEGWAIESDLDLQWAHAIAPGAKLVLVEASSNMFVDLFQAVQVGSSLGEYLSMSWGGPEFPVEAAFDFVFNPSGVSFFAAAGDTPEPSYPATSPQVVAVGGTTLHLDDGEVESETAWASGGGGCSVFLPASTAQSNFAEYPQSGCNGWRATPDVSAVGDPATGVSTYTTIAGHTGWFVLGGTSASAPIVAGAAATTRQLVKDTFVYGNNIDYRDITVGANAGPCLIGFDLCSGRGAPLGDD